VTDVWAGIDPGKAGYVAVIHADGHLQTWPVPLNEEGDYALSGVDAVGRALASCSPRLVMLERQQPAYRAPGQDKAFNNLVRASFVIGYGFAMWEMLLTTFRIPYELVMPSVWKKQMRLTAAKEVTERGARAKAAKGNSVTLAIRLWPNHDFRRTPRCKPSPDQCEAALLAEYGRRKHGGS
jgi:hypothetical protein